MTLENVSLLGYVFILSNVVTRFMWVKVVDEAVFMFVCEKACRMVLVHVLKIVNFMSAVTTLCYVTDV